MSIRYARHFSRIYNTPLLIAPHALDALMPAVERVLRNGTAAPDALVSVATERSEKTGFRMHGSVAIITIHGVLLHHSNYDAECNFFLGYQDIAIALDRALADPDCSVIVLDINSPGGEVAGCFDLARKIRAATDDKPIHAAINDVGCSAAYAIASACTTVSVTETAIAGSIGVVMRHVDMSDWLANEGVKVTHIYSGARKIDGNPYEPLPEPVRARFQSEINTLYGLFSGLVADFRGLSVDAVKDTEADTYMGARAVDHGLADRVEPPDALIQRLADAGQSQTAPSAATTETTMSTEHPAATPAITQENVDAAMASGMDAGARAERERIIGIVQHEAAADNMTAAIALAAKPDIDIDTAVAVLETLPKTGKAAADNQFSAHMAGIQAGQEIGADSGESDDTAESAIRRIMAA